ncbi:hypothetical protein BamMEX5DRAFT_6992 [Burkholderia ambifaria MEX-5]|uniref:Uncharacterized protein n=1 Tax=Burkholderia ambifaria MEX-5 TaxID=396597 RepID=B1TGS6_9BURK|nr:hypothetical protein BamMEX5DRAFT_6992 [Burkholderia ambifaria MEX-5]
MQRFHREHLVVRAVLLVGLQQNLVAHARYLGGIGFATKQVDDRCTKECKPGRVDVLGQCTVEAIEQHDDFGFTIGHVSQSRIQTGQCEKPEARGAGCIFVQQVMAVKLRPGQWQQTLVGSQPRVFDRSIEYNPECLIGISKAVRHPSHG